jgi:hypothetical protein
MAPLASTFTTEHQMKRLAPRRSIAQFAASHLRERRSI